MVGQGARIGANRSALLADRAPLIDQMQSSSREAVAKSGILLLPWGAEKRQNATRVKDWATTIAILALLSASLALAEDFKTVSGRVYKDATVSRVEADGIVLKTKTGISKVYFVELPKDVQEKFRPAPATPTVAPIKQHTPEQAQGGGKVVVVGQSAGTLKIVIAGVVVLLLVVLLIVRRRM